jgi:hypothetical protein
MGNAMAEDQATRPMNFQSIDQDEVPKGREGKHRKIISKLLSDIDQLAVGSALKVPLTKLTDSKENIRSALNRATRQRGIEVQTSSDHEFLYIWKSEQSS